MAKVENGNNVKVHYKGMLTDGSVFDQSTPEQPLEFTVGTGQIIPGFETAVKVMAVGEKKTINIPADEAYGPHREELVGSVERERLPQEIKPEIGQMLRVGQEKDGQSMVVRVVKVGDKEITLDGNHPLAGQDLTFDLELVEVE